MVSSWPCEPVRINGSIKRTWKIAIPKWPARKLRFLFFFFFEGRAFICQRYCCGDDHDHMIYGIRGFDEIFFFFWKIQCTVKATWCDNDADDEVVDGMIVMKVMVLMTLVMVVILTTPTMGLPPWDHHPGTTNLGLPPWKPYQGTPPWDTHPGTPTLGLPPWDPTLGLPP